MGIRTVLFGWVLLLSFLIKPIDPTWDIFIPIMLTSHIDIHQDTLPIAQDDCCRSDSAGGHQHPDTDCCQDSVCFCSGLCAISLYIDLTESFGVQVREYSPQFTFYAVGNVLSGYHSVWIPPRIV